ncbi:MAG: ADP-ribosylglycohydrolase family protein [Clostridia bacterium]|nr:ADP-ribosylglycohydrolase family protein [Clostridia bacterium]
MFLNINEYKDKVKACWIGKNIGGTMGTPYEGKREVLDIKGFITQKGEVLPNDDLDLQLVWLYALEHIGPQNITAESLGEFWTSFILPYWNEYGICKVNMNRGIKAPASGDWDNDFWKDSNGAWIRTEIWACVAPGIPNLAVKYSMADAMVDHGAGEGTFAAMFVSAMQSSAFVLDDIFDCINVGLKCIPKNSRMAQSINIVLDCYKNGKTWLEARNIILETNKDIGDGWFQAPSNVAYAVIGLLYGEGDFKKSMITAINCGDDTDCTGATVGATLGLLHGMKGIPTDWCEYIGDDIVTVCVPKHTNFKMQAPKTCTELTERVVELCGHVLYAYNITADNKYFHKNIIELTDGETTPKAEQLQRIETAINKRIVPILDNIKPYTVSASCTLCDVDVTPDVKPVVKPNTEINYKMVINSHWFMEGKPTVLKINYYTPDGVEVLGDRNVMITPVGDFTAKTNFTVKIGDVTSDIKVIVELTAPGRASTLYVPVMILA